MTFILSVQEKISARINENMKPIFLDVGIMNFRSMGD